MTSLKELQQVCANNLKDLQHVTNTFDDKVANFSKSLRMEFRETKDDMVKKIDEHVQLAIQDSRARNEDLEDRIQASVKKHEITVKSLEVKVGEMESVQKNSKSNSEDDANVLLFHGLQLNYKQNEEDLLEILNEVIKEKLDLKRELTITNIEIREVPRSLSKEAAVAVTFMDKLDKEAIVKKVETLEKNGIKLTDELSTDRLLNWYRLNKIQDNVKTKFPSILTS